MDEYNILLCKKFQKLIIFIVCFEFNIQSFWLKSTTYNLKWNDNADLVYIQIFN